MGLETLTASGLKPFTGNETEANLFFINIDARLIAAGIDTKPINEPPTSREQAASVEGAMGDFVVGTG